jgi:hypothetical protein
VSEDFPLPDLELADDDTFVFNAPPAQPVSEPWQVTSTTPTTDTAPLRSRLSSELDAIDRLEFGLDIEAVMRRLRATGYRSARASQPPPLPAIPELDPVLLEPLDS